MPYRSLATRCFLTLGCLAASSALGRGLIVSPVQVGLNGDPGSSVSAVISVASSRSESTQVEASLGDFVKDEDGDLREVGPQANPRSCRSWLSLDRSDFATPETGRIAVKVSAAIPSDVTGSYWALVAFKVVPVPRGQGMGPGVTISPRVVIPVVVTVGGTETRQVEIKQATARRVSAENAIECTAVVENTGNSAVLIRGAFSLERPGEKAEDTLELGLAEVGPLTSLPGSKLKVKSTIPWKLGVAGLVIQSYLRFGPGEADAAEFSTSIEEDPAAASAPSLPADRMAPPAPRPQASPSPTVAPPGTPPPVGP
jgi:hypothetical protein